jgi:alpha-glucosidase
VGEYVALGHRKGDTWHVGALTTGPLATCPWTVHFWGQVLNKAVIFQDGLNADRDATDYRHEVRRVTAKDKLTLYLGSGGGWAARFYPVQ